MADLYERLVEIQEITRLLAADVTRLTSQLGERSIPVETTEEEEGARRAYVRAVFALIEAIVEQHKKLLLELSSHGSVTLRPGVVEALAEQTYVVDENGSVSSRDQYLQLRRKLRAIYRAAAEGFGAELIVRYDEEGWRSFTAAVKVRDRITHPKTDLDCHISEDDLATVDAGNDWFRGVNNEFVRVAREHRQRHAW